MSPQPHQGRALVLTLSYWSSCFSRKWILPPSHSCWVSLTQSWRIFLYLPRSNNGSTAGAEWQCKHTIMAVQGDTLPSPDFPNFVLGTATGVHILLSTRSTINIKHLILIILQAYTYQEIETAIDCCLLLLHVDLKWFRAKPSSYTISLITIMFLNVHFMSN